jgi:hypothetical protein
MVTKKRMTGQDYLKKYNDLKLSLSSLDSHITERLMFLSKQFPEAIIINYRDDPIKAKCLTKGWVERESIENRILYIQNIEKWNREQENIIQLKIVE